MTVYSDSESAQIVIKSVQTILVFLNIVGNSLVCIVIVKNQDMRTSVNYLVMNLVVADMTVATFFTPRFIFFHSFTYPEGVIGTVLMCKLLTGGNLGWVGAATSVLTLVAIAIERYYAVIHPHGNKGKLTKRKLKVIIPCSWIFGFIMNIPEFLFKEVDERDYCVDSFPDKWIGRFYSVAWFLFTAFFPVSLMVITYSRVVYALWFKDADPSDTNNQQQGVMKVRKRVTLMLIIVSVIFIVCWVTEATDYLLVYFFPSHSFQTLAASSTLILFNSAVNPIVYALANQRFRDKIERMMCRNCRSPRSNSMHPAREPNRLNVAIIITHPTQETRGSYIH